jgi:hypothetical protein
MWHAHSAERDIEAIVAGFWFVALDGIGGLSTKAGCHIMLNRPSRNSNFSRASRGETLRPPGRHSRRDAVL